MASSKGDLMISIQLVLFKTLILNDSKISAKSIKYFDFFSCWTFPNFRVHKKAKIMKLFTITSIKAIS